MRRRLFNLLSVVSFILLRCLLNMWAFDIYMHVGRDRVTMVEVYDGYLIFKVTNEHRRTAWPPIQTLGVSGIRYSWGGTPYGYPNPTGYHWEIQISVVFTVVFLSLLPLVKLAGFVISRREISSAFACQTCGYDLRASTGRCPECGTPI